MLTPKELEKHPEYWLEEIQNNIYYALKLYMDEHDLNQTELAKKFGYSKGYISQIMSGEFNHSIKKFIEISLALDLDPVIEFKKKSIIENVVEKKKCKVINFNEYTSEIIEKSHDNFELKFQKV